MATGVEVEKSRSSTTCWPRARYSKDSELKDGYPEFTLAVLQKLGWDKDLTEAEFGP